jgi:hypothetical protein
MNVNQQTIKVHRMVDQIVQNSDRKEKQAFAASLSICPLCGKSVRGIGTVIVERGKKIFGPGTYYQYCNKCK